MASASRFQVSSNSPAARSTRSCNCDESWCAGAGGLEVVRRTARVHKQTPQRGRCWRPPPRMSFNPLPLPAGTSISGASEGRRGLYFLTFTGGAVTLGAGGSILAGFSTLTAFSFFSFFSFLSFFSLFRFSIFSFLAVLSASRLFGNDHAVFSSTTGAGGVTIAAGAGVAAGAVRRAGAAGAAGLGSGYTAAARFPGARRSAQSARARVPLGVCAGVEGPQPWCPAASADLAGAEFAGTEGKLEVAGISVHLAVFPDEETGRAGLGGKRADQQGDVMRVAETRLEERQVVGIQRDAFACVAAKESCHSAARCNASAGSPARSAPYRRHSTGTAGHGCSRTRLGRNPQMETTSGLPGETSPTSNPPISEPREVSERKLSTASRSSRSIRLNGIRTDTGFCGTSQRYNGEGAGCKSKRSARAVDSVIEILRRPPGNKLKLDQLTMILLKTRANLSIYFWYFFIDIKCGTRTVNH